MRVLSLFDGISCGRVALERAGLHVETYVAYEIDKFATKVSESNYPDIVRCGNVLEADFTQYKGFDLVMGGFPCTDLSIAKKDRKGLKGEHSILFWELVRAIKEVKPRHFLVENNASMPAADKAIITETLGVEPIMINSSLVSAQNRKRLYWTNIPGVVQPEDRHICLFDIIEDGLTYQDKSYTVTAIYAGAQLKNTLERHQRAMVFQRARGKNKGGFKFDKSPTLTANSRQTNNHAAILICVNSKDEIGKQPSQSNKIYSINGKPACITEAHKPYIAEPIRIGQYGKGGQGQRIYSVRGKSVTLKSNGGGQGACTGLYKINLPDGDYIVRKLTPVECERLQTLPDNYTVAVSNTQRYKCLGNGWTIEVIAHFFMNLK